MHLMVEKGEYFILVSILKLCNFKIFFHSIFLLFKKHILIFSGVRGGVSTITTRHSKANNKYHPKEYDPELLSLFLAYLDANNLYGESYIL